MPFKTPKNLYNLNQSNQKIIIIMIKKLLKILIMMLKKLRNLIILGLINLIEMRIMKDLEHQKKINL